MAGEWIKVRTNLWNDPRVSQLCDLTGTPEAMIVGGLYWLWATADEHTETGLMPGLSLSAVDRKTGIVGFGAALVSIDWVHETANGIVLARFDEHNGTSAKTRAQTARRVANHKNNAQVTPESQTANAPTVSLALPREEKRREEDTTTSSSDDVRKCPTGTLVDLYHEMMPNNPKVKVLSEARKGQIRQRWREAASLDCKPFGYDSRSGGLEAWKLFFKTCSNSKFLTGLAPPEQGKPPFFADIDFIFSPSGFAKILENKYHRDAT